MSGRRKASVRDMSTPRISRSKTKPPSYRFYNIRNQRPRVVMLGHTDVYSKPSNGEMRCMYTLEPIEHYPVGIPIKRSEDEHGRVVFTCIDVFGTFSDCYAELLKRRRDRAIGYMYTQSEELLYELFNIHYPGEVLTVSPDNRLLKIFNGPLTIEEFRSSALPLEKPVEDNMAVSQEKISLPIPEEFY